MTAREEILSRVRSALVGVEQMIDLPAAPLSGTKGDLLALFADRVADYRAVVEQCAEAELTAVVVAALAGRSVVVPAGLGLDLPNAIVDTGLTSFELDRIDSVVTRARVGIAETGTVVLDHAPDQGRRAISLVPDHHICIVQVDQIVADVPDAFPFLDPALPLTWISGPSATSDIELERVEGVHGPRTLHIIVVSPAGDQHGATEPIVGAIPRG